MINDAVFSISHINSLAFSQVLYWRDDIIIFLKHSRIIIMKLCLKPCSKTIGPILMTFNIFIQLKKLPESKSLDLPLIDRMLTSKDFCVLDNTLLKFVYGKVDNIPIFITQTVIYKLDAYVLNYGTLKADKIFEFSIKEHLPKSSSSLLRKTLQVLSANKHFNSEHDVSLINMVNIVIQRYNDIFTAMCWITQCGQDTPYFVTITASGHIYIWEFKIALHNEILQINGGQEEKTIGDKNCDNKMIKIKPYLGLMHVAPYKCCSVHLEFLENDVTAINNEHIMFGVFSCVYGNVYAGLWNFPVRIDRNPKVAEIVPEQKFNLIENEPNCYSQCSLFQTDDMMPADNFIVKRIQSLDKTPHHLYLIFFCKSGHAFFYILKLDPNLRNAKDMEDKNPTNCNINEKIIILKQLYVPMLNKANISGLSLVSEDPGDDNWKLQFDKIYSLYLSSQDGVLQTLKFKISIENDIEKNSNCKININIIQNPTQMDVKHTWTKSEKEMKSAFFKSHNTQDQNGKADKTSLDAEINQRLTPYETNVVSYRGMSISTQNAACMALCYSPNIYYEYKSIPQPIKLAFYPRVDKIDTVFNCFINSKKPLCKCLDFALIIQSLAYNDFLHYFKLIQLNFELTNDYLNKEAFFTLDNDDLKFKKYLYLLEILLAKDAALPISLCPTEQIEALKLILPNIKLDDDKLLLQDLVFQIRESISLKLFCQRVIHFMELLNDVLKNSISNVGQSQNLKSILECLYKIFPFIFQPSLCSHIFHRYSKTDELAKYTKLYEAFNNKLKLVETEHLPKIDEKTISETIKDLSTCPYCLQETQFNSLYELKCHNGHIIVRCPYTLKPCESLPTFICDTCNTQAHVSIIDLWSAKLKPIRDVLIPIPNAEKYKYDSVQGSNDMTIPCLYCGSNFRYADMHEIAPLFL